MTGIVRGYPTRYRGYCTEKTKSWVAVSILSCICASGPEGAVAVGKPTERSGARSHAVGRRPRRPNWFEEGRSANTGGGYRLISGDTIKVHAGLPVASAIAANASR